SAYRASKSTAHPEQFLPIIEHTADPLVKAIRDFEAAQERLPQTLQELVPRSIAAIPSTGFPANQQISYSRAQAGGWRLVVYDDFGIGFRSLPAEFEYEPRTGKWRYRP